jgi:hypothetical protein
MTNTVRIKQLARLVLAAFVLTFLTARLVVMLIMTRRLPNMFLYVGGTHIHHLNYGIFLLSALCGYLLLKRPVGRGEDVCAILYGTGLALTFDEFGMWLHLGGAYSQRVTFDAIALIAALFGLLSIAPKFASFGWKHWMIAVVIILVIIPFLWLLNDSLRFAEQQETGST